MSNAEKRLKEIIRYANTPIARHYFKFSAPSLNLIASGNRDLRGIRSGAVIELLGAKSSGKSTLALDLVANAQKAGHSCFWIDIERWFDPDSVGPYAESMGVDTSTLGINYPRTAQEAFGLAQEKIQEGIGLIVIDSIAAAIPKEEWDKDYDEVERMGESAKLVKRFVQRAVIDAFDSNTLVVLMNQVRANISPQARKATKRAGGHAYAHALHLALELTVTEHKDADKWKNVSVFIEKNRLGGEERIKTDIELNYGKGIRWDKDIINEGVRAGVINQSGKWYNYNEYKAQGKENAVLTFPLDDIKRELETYYAKGN